MGQALGRAPLPKGSKRFINLPRSCIYELWDCFNDIAEGFGLTIDEFHEIIKSALLEHLDVTEKILLTDTDYVFRIFDSDENNLIDSLEFLSAFALLSGMTPDEKLQFLFAMYDFEESGLLSLDEIVLAFRSTLSGLSKLSRIDPPSEQEIESIIIQSFESVNADSVRNNKEPTLDYQGMEKEAFITFCLNSPEVMSWIDYFDDLEDFDIGPQFHVKVGESTINKFNNELVTPYTVNLARKKLDNSKLPWETVLPLLTSTRVPDGIIESPSQNFNIEWIYGYNGHCSRQNLYYNSKGEIVYPAGSVCVVYNIQLSTQQYFISHTDIILCLKLFHDHDGKTIVATGELGLHPAVHVWDCDSKKILSTLKGFHKNGVSSLDFSMDKTKLLTIGMDSYHSIAVYSWRSKEKIYTTRTTSNEVHDIKFISKDMFASCGKDHIYFWKQNKYGKFKRYRGLFGPAVKPETLKCLVVVGKNIVACSDSGMLRVWESRNLVSTIKGHTAAIQACYAVEQGSDSALVTACVLGKIQIWNSKLEIVATFNSNALGAIDAAVVAICWNVVSSKIVIGFKTCEIIEIYSTDGRNCHNSAIVSGHYSPKVKGLSTHPFKPKFFCSVSDDKTIRIFDADEKKQLRACSLSARGSCCSYSPDGQTIIVGFGSGIINQEDRKEGGYVLLSEEDLTVVHEGRDSKQIITDCKFNADGQAFALGSGDGCIYVYNTKDASALARCRGHSGKITHIDLSTDGRFMMSNDVNGELIFWDILKGDQQAPRNMREIQWITNTCVNSFITQKIWSISKDIVYNSTARSNSKELVASVDNFGDVRVFKAPCLREDPPFIVCHGHARNALNCQFACDDSRLFTSGGTDGCIIQWKVQSAEFQDIDSLKRVEITKENLLSELKFEGNALDRYDKYDNIINDLPLSVFEMEESITDTRQILPWQRTIVAPSRVPIEDNSEPPDALDIEFVYGYSSDKSRNTLIYASTGEIMFFVASIIVLMNQKHRTQRYYDFHKATVTSIASNSVDGVVCSGEMAELPSIRVWNPITLQTITVLQGFHTRAVSHLKFSYNGAYIVSVGQDIYHSIAIYDWKNSQCISSCQSFVNKSFFIDFSPSGNTLVHCGNEIIRFYDLDGGNMHYKTCLFGKRAKLQGYLCSEWIGNNVVVGTVDGNLYRFIDNRLDGVILAHSDCINSITSTTDGVCTGSSDGFIKFWTRILECRLVVDARVFRCINVNIRSVCCDKVLGRVMFGTNSGEVFEITSHDGENMHTGALLEGHGGDELWGLASNPVKEEFCTVGDDAILRFWDLASHSSISSVQLEMPARCCAYSPDGKSLAIGFGSPRKVKARQYDGKWIILETSTAQITHEARDSTKWITDIKYSPNGEFIAMGSFDSKIYVYSVSSGYALNAVISQHHSNVTSLDFSSDSAWIQSTCAGYELCFFEADTGIYIPAASRLRDTVWATQTCTLGWAVQGLWPPQQDGTEITSCDCNLLRGSDETVIVSGDNFGRLQVYRYPCTSTAAIGKRYRIASNPITRVRFVSGDSAVVSLIGLDKAIIQWRHRQDRGEKVAWDVLERRGQVQEDEDDVVTFFGQVSSEDTFITQNSLSTLSISRPWLATLVPPTVLPNLIVDPPTLTLEKLHIFGLYCEKSRSSVHYTNDDDVVYPASRYVCIYSKKLNTQYYYEQHAAEVSCVAVSQDRNIVASSERCLRPQIHVWDTNTGQNICILPFYHRKAVSYMEFSSDRKYLVSVGQDSDYSIAVWESPTASWFDAVILASAKGDVNPVLFCNFLSTSATQPYLLASGGRFHQKFWSLSGRCLNPEYPELDAKVKLGTLLCGCANSGSGGQYLSGSSSGHLYVWRGRKLDRIIHAHELGISCIWACSVAVITASKDGTVKIWSAALEHIRSFSLKDSDVTPLLQTIRSVDAALTLDSQAVTRILVSTASGEIYEIAAKSGYTCLLQEAHYSGELWGLCVHPVDPDIFATSGDDKTVRIWSISQKRIIRKAVLDCTARCLSWSPDGKLILVGMGGEASGRRQRKDGAFLIIDGLTLKPVFEGRDSRHWIQCAKFSPNGKSFAIGSLDHKAYIYNSDNYRLKGTCDRNGSHIRALDFSTDSLYLQCDSADYEHLYFEAEDGEYITAGSQLRDVKWSDSTCCFGWHVQGAWPPMDEVERKKRFEPVCMHKSPEGTLLAVGDTAGNLSIYNYPCVSKQAEVKLFPNAHSMEISQVRFTVDNKYIISIGKMDKSIILWKVKPLESTQSSRK